MFIYAILFNPIIIVENSVQTTEEVPSTSDVDSAGDVSTSTTDTVGSGLSAAEGWTVVEGKRTAKKKKTVRFTDVLKHPKGEDARKRNNAIIFNTRQSHRKVN